VTPPRAIVKAGLDGSGISIGTKSIGRRKGRLYFGDTQAVPDRVGNDTKIRERGRRMGKPAETETGGKKLAAKKTKSSAKGKKF